MMTKTKFLESKQYLHLADNNTINSSDEFANIQPLFFMLLTNNAF